MNDEDIESKQPLEARVAERCALQIAQTFSGNRVLCSSLGRGQAAAALAKDRPEAEVTLWYLDQYWQHRAAAEIGDLEGLSIVCSADFPSGPYDLAVLPFSFRGEAELTRDLIQDAFDRLAIGGHLVVSTDNPRDRWLHDHLREMFPKVTVIASEDAVGYAIHKRAEQKRPRPLKCEFAFRDGDRLLRAVSRPGVFSHRRLDPGARQLIDAVAWPINHSSSQPLRVIDIGCGCGAVGIAIAARGQASGQSSAVPVEVLSIDSNARAVACTAESAQLNQVTTLTAQLSCTGEVEHPSSYHLALANPPYYADFRIAKLFVDSALKAIIPGGTLYLVTKHATWYQENLFPGWRDVIIRPHGQYYIVTARRG